MRAVDVRAHSKAGRWPPGKVLAAAGIIRRELKRRGVEGERRGKRSDPFRTLISCVLSLRTKDAVTAEASARLLGLARDPRRMLELSGPRIARAIFPVGFYRTKAGHILGICRAIIEKHGGRVPGTEEGLLALKGVGRKTANLVLGRAFGKPAICVDIHVHRISNRLGMVSTGDPGETETALMGIVPKRLWTEWNLLLVPFGQLVCAPVSPRCSECGLKRICARKDVKSSR